MQNSNYVALHVHTEYSLLDGAIRVDELVNTAFDFGMPAVAITDHGNMFGAVDFYRKATAKGIKPIIGCEVYVAQGKYNEKPKQKAGNKYYHLVLIAKNAEGYKNLVSLVSKAYTEGFYYKPRIDKDLLEKHSGGLIALSACLKGEVPQYIISEDMDKAKQAADWYKEVFAPGDFYLEIQENGLTEQTIANNGLVKLSKELDIKLVATNDCHYLTKEDAEAHDILICIQTSKTVNDENRLKFATESLYFKSPREMKAAFSQFPDALTNTCEVAEKCDFNFKMDEFMLPLFETNEGVTPEGQVEQLAKEGLKAKLGKELSEDYVERFDGEIEIINKMGFASYFLIVWDFINYARNKDIPVGPGRGSAAGSLVAYGLGITDIDPLKYNLLFERFLNPERISMPDIDVDFCRDRRSEVIAYTAQKYGKEHVAQIITFGTMAAKAALRDVGRALALPYALVDSIAKLVPSTLNITLKEALEEEKELRQQYKNSKDVKKLIDIARRLEGLCRHASTHAAGVVISPTPLTDYAPLYRSPSGSLSDNQSEDVQELSLTTQYDMSSIEKIGLLKFDFLGLKTLTVIKKTLDYLKERGVEFDMKDIPLDDKETFDLLSKGHTTGIFQLESSGMRDIIMKMGPNRFEDLVALVALYRPGPLGSGMIDDFIKRKKKQIPVSYEHEMLADVLDETYGIILYQEQVMRIANKMANFSMGQADILRKAMGKKKAGEMEKLKGKFVEGAVANKIPQKKATKIFDLMAQFAKYGFNKSHSAAYAYISYQTAYLKAHCPVEFMAANMSSEDTTEKIVKFINECKERSIEILLPDINDGMDKFTIKDNGIMFGLEAVKGVGVAAIDSILSTRENGKFESLEDFVSRVDSKKVNKKVIESLIKAGAFDKISNNRYALVKRVEKLLTSSRNLPTLFGEPSFLPNDGYQSEYNDWPELEKLKYEKETLGFYITSHPLKNYREKLIKMGIIVSFDFDRIGVSGEVTVACAIAGVKKKMMRDKSGKIAILNLEDKDGRTIEGVVFKDLLQKTDTIITKDNLAIIKGKLDKIENGYKIVALEVSDLDVEIKDKLERMDINLMEDSCDSTILKRLKTVLDKTSGGDLSVYLNFENFEEKTVVAIPYRTPKDGKIISEIKEAVRPYTVTLN